jgi:hypothetical protein
MLRELLEHVVERLGAGAGGHAAILPGERDGRLDSFSIDFRRRSGNWRQAFEGTAVAPHDVAA